METKNNKLPLSEYPRPNFVRDSYLSLNGSWDYAILNVLPDNIIDVKYQGEVVVPYPVGSKKSKVEHILQPNEYLIYRKQVKLPTSFIKYPKGHLLLTFLAVDQIATLYLDGKKIYRHIGGYLPFTVDLFKYLEKEDKKTFELVLVVKDLTDTSFYSRGKQTLKDAGIWYKGHSGIYMPVFIENVPKTYIEDIKVTPLFDSKEVIINPISSEDLSLTLELEGENYQIKSNKDNVIAIKDFKPWTPDNPYLYNFKLTLENDIVFSYFGLRKIEIKLVSLEKKKKFLRFYLNNEPIFLNGLLDQGYWAESLVTPNEDNDYLYDIRLAKSLGYNTLRKHVKLESPRFYYHCDKEGILLIQDFVNGGEKYNKFVTMVAGFLGLEIKDHKYKCFGQENPASRVYLMDEFKGIINHLYNHPSIIMWTIFNEGWGQFNSKDVFETLKEIDKTRLFDVASGWHDLGVGKIKSVHKYFVPYKERKDKYGRLKFLSEFGGYSLLVKDNFYHKKPFGYRFYKSKNDLTYAIDKLYRKQIFIAIKKGLSGAIYTELSDVEGEVNGLVTYDRKVIKVKEEKIRKINKDLQKIFEKTI